MFVSGFRKLFRIYAFVILTFSGSFAKPTTEAAVPVKSVMSPPIMPPLPIEHPKTTTEPMSFTYEDYEGSITDSKNNDFANEKESGGTAPYGQFVDEEMYYKYNTTQDKIETEYPEYDKLAHYAGRSSIIVVVVFVSSALVAFSCSTYRNILKLVPNS